MQLSSISLAITSLTGRLFSPQSIFTTGINGAWYDPSDFSTMFQDAAGTVPVPSVGQPVGRILDKSGRGNHAFNPSGNSANFPVLQQDGTGRYYLAFNGVNQWLQTNSIDFTYGDKMFVSAGVRKLSDAAAGSIVELGPLPSDSGWFTLIASSLGTGPNRNSYGAAITAGSNGPSLEGRTYASPITNTVSCSYDIAATGSTNEIKLRVNGITPTINVSSSADAVGTFQNSSLYVGARAGTGLFFNGHLYGLVVAGKQASASEIASTEAWLNQKTGAY